MAIDHVCVYKKKNSCFVFGYIKNITIGILLYAIENEKIAGIKKWIINVL